VFVGQRGGPLRRANFHAVWAPARTAVGLGEMHFHDYADIGLTWIHRLTRTEAVRVST
jgi:hypothetical protein